MIIFLANQFVGDTISSGGDVLFTKVLEKTNIPSVVLIPQTVYNLFISKYPKSIIVKTDNFVKIQSASTVIGGIIITYKYLIRTLNSIVWLLMNIKPTDTLYLTGDFYCNSLPALCIKKYRPRVNIVSNFFHRNPKASNRIGNHPIVSYFSRLIQSISLRLIRYSSTKVFVLSEEGKRELLSLGFSKSAIVVSGAGVDREILSRYKNIKKNENSIIYIGRINVTKGAFDLVEILRILDKMKKKWKCHFVGQGTKDDIAKLQKLAIDAGISNNIIIHGYIDDDKKYRLLASSSILVLPSKEEGFGIVIPEALSLGTKVVCFDLPALKHLFSRYSTVYFAKQNDLKMFAEYIDRIIDVRSDINSEDFTFPDWNDVYKIQSLHFAIEPK